MEKRKYTTYEYIKLEVEILMIGREKELAQIENLYNRDCFEFLGMYVRRRVGTELFFIPHRKKMTA